MKSNELREKSVDELKALSEQERKALFDLRFQHYTGQLTNTAALTRTRRNVARIETLIRERQLSAVAE